MGIAAALQLPVENPYECGGRLKILSIFNEYLQPGGEAEGVAQICAALRQTHQIEECRFSSAAWKGADAPNVFRQALYMIRNPTSLSALGRINVAFRPDAWLVHNVFPAGSAAIYREAGSLRMPVIQYLHNFRPFSVNGYLWAGRKIAPGGLKRNFFEEIWHGAWQESQIKTLWFAFVLELMHTFNWFSCVKAWVAISDFLRDKMIEAGLPAADVFTLPYPWRLQNPVVNSRKSEEHYLFLGRLIDAKGITVLLQAWEKLEKQLNARTPRLIIAGSGPLEAMVRSRASNLNSVEFVGHLSGETKRRALEHSKAVIAPSLWWEALGLIAYEAYDYGKPVLAAKSGGLQETVIDGQTGFLHDPGDAGQLAEQVLQLEQRTKYRQELGHQGRQWLLQNTDADDWQRKFSQILTHVFKQSGR